MMQAEQREQPPGVEEDGEHKTPLQTSTSTEDGRLPSAPDITYDATILESQSERRTRDGETEEEEGGGEPVTEEGSSTAKEKAVRFEEELKEQAAERTEGDGKEEGEWMDILGSGELKKKVLRQGGGVETRATPLCRVRIRTKGQLDSGAVVDKHHSVPFTLGDGDVIQAWDLTVSLMAIGEVALVNTSPRFAYGKVGRSPDVPNNASITYELELLEVQEPVDFQNVTEKELNTLIDRKRIRGNELFQRKDFELAINSYDKALKLIESYTAEQAEESLPSTVTDLHVRCLNNLAAAYLKVERYKESDQACQKVLEKDPENVKALFRYGKVLAIQGELVLAVEKLQRALDLNPKERAIQAELQKALKKKERIEKEERAMYKRMVEGVSQETKTAKKDTGSTNRWGPLPYFAVAGLVATIGITFAYFLTQRHN